MPTLFNIVLDEVVRKVQETAYGVGFHEKVQALVSYADNAVIFGSNEEDIKNTTKELITGELIMRLMINEEKTKHMVITRGI